MHASAGILTSRGGMTSHAAVVARGLGKPCIVGAGDLDVDEHAGEVRVEEQVFREGDELSIDGTTGEVLAGALPTRPSEVLRVLLDGAEPSPAAQGFRQAPRVGRRRAPPPHPRQRRHAPRRPGGRRPRRRGHRPLPHRAHVLRRGAHRLGAADDPGRRPREPRRTALAQAPAHAAAGLRGDLRRPDRPADHRPPARSAAPRVPAARRRRPCASSPSRWGSTPPTSRPGPRRWRRPTPCSACAAAGWASPRPRSTRCRSRRSSAPPACARKAGDDVRPEIMVPLVGTEAGDDPPAADGLGGRRARPARRRGSSSRSSSAP